MMTATCRGGPSIFWIENTDIVDQLLHRTHGMIDLSGFE